MPKPARARESGYALLFIFLTMAIIGIMFYAAMPRVAFEAQRDQEQLLIDRGEQYKRAIQVYFRKFKKYPAKIEDLENSSNQRFLRQRYKDPMTGKDEWRPIHIGANGQFTDSLTQKSNQKKPDAASVNNFITELKPMGDGSNPANSLINPGLRRRPSDLAGGGNPGAPDQPVVTPEPLPAGAEQVLIEEPDNNLGVNAGNNLNSNLNPGNLGGLNSDPNSVPVNPGLPAALGLARGNPNVNPNNFDPNNPNNAANGFPNQTPIPGQNPSGANMIRNILTSPRPGGPPPGIFGGNQVNDVGPLGQQNPNAFQPGGNNNLNQFPTPQAPTNVLGNGSTTPNQPGTTLGNSTVGGQTVGGGIAGFASKAERPGIKIYNEKTKYNEWEFIYDYAKDKTMGGGQQIPTQTGNGLNGNNNGTTGTLGTGAGTGSVLGAGTATTPSGISSPSAPSTGP